MHVLCNKSLYIMPEATEDADDTDSSDGPPF